MKKALLILGIFSFGLVFAATAMADTIPPVVSDTNVEVHGPIDHYAGIDSSDWGESNGAVLTWKHPSWPTIEGASWISSAYDIEKAMPDSWRMFSTEIVLPECAADISGKVKVTSDNAEEVYLNGVLVGKDGEVQGAAHDDREWNTVLEYDLTGLLHTGTNELKIIVRNYAYNTDDPKTNPTGLIYKAAITYNNGDSDNDGVCDYEDKCLGIDIDEPIKDLGVNRHIWKDGEYFTTLVPAKKGIFNETTSQFSIADTYGCSCRQILDKMKEKTGFDFGGHYKFGCSKSIIEDWIAGRYYMGLKLQETVEVPANDTDGIVSNTTPEPGTEYVLKAYGTANAGDTIDLDAKYSITKRILEDTWTDTVSGYESYGPELLDLFVNGSSVDWGAYNDNHTYYYSMTGTGTPLALKIYDIYYPNNTGSLFVDILFHYWIDLW